MNNLSTLNILPVNRTVVFYSPLQDKDVLVRTGTIADGSCFFHSILHAYSKDYISMSTEDRIKYVKKLRVSMSKKVDKENEARAIGICTKSVINNKGFTRGKFTCKKKGTIVLKKKKSITSKNRK